ncbi:MAG: site-specific DNA-methyltransferase, partial [Candidatus Thorarchaeota archaeon]
MIKIENKDFLEFLKDVEDSSVDLILIDPPFNTTPCSWDKEINLKEMWREFKRVAKPTTPILICSQ